MTKSRAQTRPVRAVFIGSGAFAEPALRALAHDPAVEIVGVVTAPAAAGRSEAGTRRHAAGADGRASSGPDRS